MLHAWTTPRPASLLSPNHAMPTQAYALFPTRQRVSWRAQGACLRSMWRSS